jgi:hypothetical protein
VYKQMLIIHISWLIKWPSILPPTECEFFSLPTKTRFWLEGDLLRHMPERDKFILKVYEMFFKYVVKQRLIFNPVFSIIVQKINFLQFLSTLGAKRHRSMFLLFSCCGPNDVDLRPNIWNSRHRYKTKINDFSHLICWLILLLGDQTLYVLKEENLSYLFIAWRSHLQCNREIYAAWTKLVWGAKFALYENFSSFDCTKTTVFIKIIF